MTGAERCPGTGQLTHHAPGAGWVRCHACGHQVPVGHDEKRTWFRAHQRDGNPPPRFVVKTPQGYLGHAPLSYPIMRRDRPLEGAFRFEEASLAGPHAARVAGAEVVEVAGGWD